MAARTYHLRATGTTTQSAIASVAIIKSGSVRSAAFNMYNSDTATVSVAVWELSTVPTYQGNTNDAQGIIADGAISTKIGDLVSQNFVVPCSYRLGVGDRLYLHFVVVTGSVTQVGIVNVAVEES